MNSLFEVLFNSTRFQKLISDRSSAFVFGGRPRSIVKWLYPNRMIRLKSMTYIRVFDAINSSNRRILYIFAHMSDNQPPSVIRIIFWCLVPNQLVLKNRKIPIYQFRITCYDLVKTKLDISFPIKLYNPDYIILHYPRVTLIMSSKWPQDNSIMALSRQKKLCAKLFRLSKW